MAWTGWIGHTGQLLSPVPSTFTFQGAPAIVRRSSDFLNVYARGNDDTLQQFQWRRGEGFRWWQTHEDGGRLTAAPAAGSIEPGQEHVFVRGLDNRLWWKDWREGRGWTSWDQLGGDTTFQDAPATVSRNRDVINVYARGNDNTLLQIYWERTRGWRPAWQVHEDGGRISSAPSAISLAPDHEAVFARGMDGRLFWKEWRQGRGWTGWSPLGGSTTFQDAPCAVSRNPDVINVYARGNDNALLQIYWEVRRGWRPAWQVHEDGGRITAPPAVAGLGRNGEIVFVRGLDGSLWHKWWHRDGVSTIPLHFKYVERPENFTFTTAQAIAATEIVFAGAMVWARVLSVEQLTRPDLLDIETDGCINWGPDTHFNASQHALFGNRNNAGPEDIVVFFVRSAGGADGCASSPDNRPSAIVGTTADVWVTPHEIGHKIGLYHQSSSTHIMFDSEWTASPPHLQVLGFRFV